MRVELGVHLGFLFLQQWANPAMQTGNNGNNANNANNANHSNNGGAATPANNGVAGATNTTGAS